MSRHLLSKEATTPLSPTRRPCDIASPHSLRERTTSGRAMAAGRPLLQRFRATPPGAGVTAMRANLPIADRLRLRITATVKSTRRRSRGGPKPSHHIGGERSSIQVPDRVPRSGDMTPTHAGTGLRARRTQGSTLRHRPPSRRPFANARSTEGRCFICLATSHRARDCRDPVKCFRCGRSGHIAAHCERPRRPVSVPPPPPRATHRPTIPPPPPRRRTTNLPPPPRPSPTSVMAKLGYPSTRPDEDTFFVPTSFDLEQEVLEWESSAMVVAAMRAPATMGVREIEAVVLDEMCLHRGDRTAHAVSAGSFVRQRRATALPAGVFSDKASVSWRGLLWLSKHIDGWTFWS
jgi:hypothetical protein